MTRLVQFLTLALCVVIAPEGGAQVIVQLWESDTHHFVPMYDGPVYIILTACGTVTVSLRGLLGDCTAEVNFLGRDKLMDPPDLGSGINPSVLDRECDSGKYHYGVVLIYERCDFPYAYFVIKQTQERIPTPTPTPIPRPTPTHTPGPSPTPTPTRRAKWFVGPGAGYDFDTITKALGETKSGEEILVSDGTYSEETGEEFPLGMVEGVTLKRASEDILPIIRGNGKQSVIESDVNSGTLQGFLITNGSTGVTIESGALKIVSCTMSKNKGYQGGGIYCDYGSPLFENCIISHNEAGCGGGIHCDSKSRPSFTSCRITGNRSHTEGGGVCIWRTSEPTFMNCVITGNTAGYCGGGVISESSTKPRFVNCTLVGNCAAIDDTVLYDGPYGKDRFGAGFLCGAGEPILMNCILWNNVPDTFYRHPPSAPVVTFCDIERGCEGAGNMSSAPMFDDPGHWTGTPGESDWVDGDYHLADNSPCIDAGKPDPEYDDECSPPGEGTRRNDIGAYGGPENCGWVMRTPIRNWMFH